MHYRNKIRLSKLASILSFTILVMGLIFGANRLAQGQRTSASLPDGETFTVNSIGDDDDANAGDNVCETSTPGECTLRAAIRQANANSNSTFQDHIEFNISGAGVKTLTPVVDLIITQPLSINGYSQPGALANSSTYPDPFNGTLLIELDLSSHLGFGLGIASDNVDISGLVINRGDNASLSITDSDSVNIFGNYFDVDNTGLIGKPGTIVDKDTVMVLGSTNVNIGSSNPAERNIIAGCIGGCVYVGKNNTQVSSNIKIQGNYIGLGADGVTSLGSANLPGIGITGESEDITIGGASAAEGNSIENNQNSGVSITSANRVLIRNNSIIGSVGSGVFISTTPPDGEALAQNISVLENSIYLNDAIGISVGGGITNDYLDADSGPNGKLNSPTYFPGDTVEDGGNTEITYGLDVPVGDYRIEFYSSPTETEPLHQGYQLLGYQNVTSLGNGLQTFTYTATGTGHSNITLTATEIKPSNPSGFGATSQFGKQGQPQEADVSITKTLTNPEDLAQGAVLNYDINFTNEGPGVLNMDKFNGSLSDPITSNMYIDIVPPDLTPSDIDLGSPGLYPGTYYLSNTGNADVECMWLGPATAAYFGFSSHPDYGLLFCTYVGTSNRLISGDSLDTSINFTVSGDSELGFKNYVAASTPDPGINTEPDRAYLDAMTSSGEDSIDYVLANGEYNNFAQSGLSSYADTGVTASLVNPEDVAPGNTVFYDVTLQNRGPAGIDLADFSSFSSNLFSTMFPAQDLDLVGSTTSGVGCTDLGPGSIAYVGAAGSSHLNHQLAICVYSGASHIITSGNSYTVRLQFTVKDPVSSSFSTYFSIIPGSGDPDLTSFTTGFYGASGDVLDILTNDNFAKVAFPITSGGGGDPSPDPSGSNSGGNSSSSKSGLSGTGQNIMVLVGIGLVLLTASAFLVVYKKRSQNKA